MIGERLFELRKDASITQQQLADEFSVSKHTISNYELEHSEPNDNMKIRIAEYFNVSIDYLLGVANEPMPIKNDKSVIRLPVKLSKQTMKELKKYIVYLIENDK